MNHQSVNQSEQIVWLKKWRRCFGTKRLCESVSRDERERDRGKVEFRKRHGSEEGVTDGHGGGSGVDVVDVVVVWFEKAKRKEFYG